MVLTHELHEAVKNHAELLIFLRACDECVDILALGEKPVTVLFQKLTDLRAVHFRMGLNPPDRTMFPFPDLIAAVAIASQDQHVRMVGFNLIAVPMKGSDPLGKIFGQGIVFGCLGKLDFRIACVA